jgi:hypothetical protein
LDERTERNLKAIKDKAQIRHEAERVFTALWEEVMREIKHAGELQWNLTTNGQPLERMVKFGERHVFIALDQDSQVIKVHGAHSLELKMAVCDDGVVCLKHDGKQVLLSDATRLILEPLIFGS